MKVFLKVYYIVLIYCVFGELFFDLPAITTDILAIGFIFLSSYDDRYKLKISRKEGIFFLNSITVPAVVILVYSLITQLLYCFSYDYLLRTVTLCTRLVLYCLLGMRAVYLNEEKIIKLLLVSCIVAYIPAIIEYFIEYGFVSGIVYLFSSNIYAEQIALEVHRLTYVFGFITIYFFFQKFIYGKKVMAEFIISLIFTLIGMKRVVYVALAVVMILTVLIKRMRAKTAYIMLCIGSVFMVFAALGYVYLIKSGLLQQIFEHFGIEDNFRFNFWNYLSPKYEFSPSFLGYGLSYSHRIMWHEWSNIKDLSYATNLHNDILGYYVGLGFWGFILFWLMYFYGQVRMLKKRFSVKAAAFSFLLSLYYFIIMATSNEGMPGFIYGLYFTVIVAAVAADKKENTDEVTV